MDKAAVPEKYTTLGQVTTKKNQLVTESFVSQGLLSNSFSH